MFQNLGADISKFGKKYTVLLTNPQELNSYSYVLNNPIGYIDLNGEAVYVHDSGQIEIYGDDEGTYYESDDTTMLNQNAAYMEENFLRADKFIEKVKPGGDWDFKEDNREMYFFEGELVDKETYGNAHYGYTGTAGGFGSKFLKDAAGMAQVWVGLGQWNHVLNNYDDPKDSKNIDRGSSSYTKSHKNKSTASSKAMDAAYNSQLQALARALNTLQKVLKQLSKQLKK